MRRIIDARLTPVSRSSIRCVKSLSAIAFLSTADMLVFLLLTILCQLSHELQLLSTSLFLSRRPAVKRGRHSVPYGIPEASFRSK